MKNEKIKTKAMTLAICVAILVGMCGVMSITALSSDMSGEGANSTTNEVGKYSEGKGTSVDDSEKALLVYVEVLDIYEYSVGGTIDWTHAYDGSENPIDTAELTIVADDVDGPGNGMDGEQDEVYFNGHYLGLLNDMGYYTDWSYHPGPGNPNQPLTTTTFDLNPTWIKSTNYVEVVVEESWGVEIETSTLTVESTCPAEYAVYQAGVPDPDGILNPLRELRDDNLKAEYVDRYYDYSPELTMVMTRDPALAYEAARLLVKYSPMVKQEVYGIGMDKLITKRDVEEIVSFTNRLKSGVGKNRGEIGATRSQEIIKFMDKFKEQVEASEGKTFSEALQSSIYCEGD